MMEPRVENRFCFTSYGVSVGIYSNSRLILEKAVETATNALLGNVKRWQVTDPEHSFRLIQNDDVCSIYQDGREMVTGSPDFKFWKYFDSLVRILVAEHAEEVVFVHAGVVGWRGKAVVFPGSSFQGKTTLVAELVRHGAEYYSDEYAVLDKDGLVHPFARRLSLRNSEGTIRETPVSAEDLGATTGVLPLPAGMIVFTKYEKGADWNPQILSSGRGVIEIVPQTIPIRANTDFVMSTLAKAVAGAVIVKSDRYDASKFAGYFLDFVDNTII